MVVVGWVGFVCQDFKVEENWVIVIVVSDDVGFFYCLCVVFCGVWSFD